LEADLSQSNLSLFELRTYQPEPSRVSWHEHLTKNSSWHCCENPIS